MQGDGDPTSLSERMASAARELQRPEDLTGTYREAADLARSNVDGCDAAGLSIVRRRETVETLAASGAMAAEGDRLQYDTGEGPCLSAIWEQTTVYSPDLGSDERWPTWGARVVEETGARSVLSFQLFTHEDTLGALNLYSHRRDGFDASDREDGLALAAHIAIAVTAAQSIQDLTHGAGSRTAIGQATGVLMERYGLGPAAAFAVLTRVSGQEQVKVRDLADHLVRTGHLP